GRQTLISIDHDPVLLSNASDGISNAVGGLILPGAHNSVGGRPTDQTGWLPYDGHQSWYGVCVVHSRTTRGYHHHVTGINQVWVRSPQTKGGVIRIIVEFLP